MHLRSFPLLGALLALASPASAQASNPDSAAGKVLYVTSPACGSFRCTVTWTLGEVVLVNWLLPPAGKVNVALVSNLDSTQYPIASSFPAVTSDCDAGAGPGVAVPGTTCGSVKFAVPAGWTLQSNYTVVVSSLSDTTAVGYTDAVMIAAAASNSTTAPPDGTSVSIIGTAPTTTSYLTSGTIAAASTAVAAGTSTRAAVASSAATSAGRPASSASGSVAAPAATTATAGAAARAASGALVSVGLFMLLL